jgi:hypothetical protein
LAPFAGAGCKGGGGSSADAGTDAAGDSKDAGLPACADPPAASDMAAADDFGPDSKAVMPSALGRFNVYEVTTPRLLERVDVYVRSDLMGSRVTISVFEALSMAKPFNKVTDVQVDVAQCQGWASSGALTIPLHAGRFYAVGFDPNQLITTYVNADMSSLPIDGTFGRLIGSKTVTSVSVTTQTWDKVEDKDFMRQRLLTSPREEDDGGDDADADAATDDGGSVGGPADVAGDAGSHDAIDAIGS